MQFEIIETSGLILKGISYSVMSEIFDSLPRHAIMEVLGHRSELDFEKEKEKHQNGYSSYNRRFLMFLLISKKTGNVIGRCGLHNWNEQHRRAEIGYIMEDEDFKNQGLMSEAVVAILAYGFEKLHLNRIDALVGESNVPSLKILTKNGFVKEGLLREHVFTGDGFENSILFSKLIGEHSSLQKG